MSEYPNGNRATEHWVEKVKSLQEEIKSLRQCIARLEKALNEIVNPTESSVPKNMNHFNWHIERAKEALTNFEERNR